MVTFSYHAEQQKKRLTPRELAEITRVLEGDEGLNRTTKTKIAGEIRLEDREKQARGLGSWQ
jgi:hypothetical protein